MLEGGGAAGPGQGGDRTLSPAGADARQSQVKAKDRTLLQWTPEAAEAFAELDYEEDKSPFEVSLRPSEFFLTCEGLDYTLVAVDESELTTCRMRSNGA